MSLPGMAELIVEFWASADEYWETIGITTALLNSNSTCCQS
jgi:hypothetical protein